MQTLSKEVIYAAVQAAYRQGLLLAQAPFHIHGTPIRNGNFVTPFGSCLLTQTLDELEDCSLQHFSLTIILRRRPDLVGFFDRRSQEYLQSLEDQHQNWLERRFPSNEQFFLSAMKS
jgi:hypothetical protein